MKKKNTNQKTLHQIQRERERLVKSANAKVPWTTVPALRELILKLQKMERRYERLQKAASKRIDRYLAKEFPKPEGISEAALVHRERFLEKRKHTMMDLANRIRGKKLVEKAERLQAMIDDIVNTPLSGVRRAA
jgi:hypothetical protein